ncbi:MAG: Fur family transcriptional regulator, partial [Bradymonadia bacterium]
MSTQAYNDDLRKAGLRPTAQRVSIAKALFEELDHPTAEDVMRSLASQDVLVSQATVYNTLHAFVKGGLLQEVYLGDGRTVYDHNVTPHHHFIDEETQAVLDIDLDE